MSLLWLLVIILILIAIFGGAFVSNFLWFILIIALIIALFSIASGRRV